MIAQWLMEACDCERHTHMYTMPVAALLGVGFLWDAQLGGSKML
jgi:hypothetical protein